MAGTGLTYNNNWRITTVLRETTSWILLSKTVKRSLMEWEPVSERILTACLNARFRNIVFKQCYAPTEITSMEEKELFYKSLTATIQYGKKSDIMILIIEVIMRKKPYRDQKRKWGTIHRILLHTSTWYRRKSIFSQKDSYRNMGVTG